MSNSVITNDNLRCVPRYKLRELYDLDDLRWLGIYFDDVESDTYKDNDGGDGE